MTQISQTLNALECMLILVILCGYVQMIMKSCASSLVGKF